MAAIAEGHPAPDFTLPSSTGGEISLSDFRGSKSVVLYFYPKDVTPGCTKEACSFRDSTAEFEKLGAQVLGVSRDSLGSHEKFAAKYQLAFPLLSDANGKVTEAYGVWAEKSMYGKTYMGIERSTFLIDTEGRLQREWRKVSVKGHAAEVLEAISAD